MGALLQPLPASSSKALEQGAVRPQRILPGLQTVPWPPCCGPGVTGGRRGAGGSQGRSAQSPRGASGQPGAFLVKIALEQRQLMFIFFPLIKN